MHIAPRTHSPHLHLADADHRPLTSPRQAVHGITCPFSPCHRNHYTRPQATRWLWGSSLISITGRDIAAQDDQALGSQHHTPAVDRQVGLRQSACRIRNCGASTSLSPLFLQRFSLLRLRAWTPCHFAAGVRQVWTLLRPRCPRGFSYSSASPLLLDGQSWITSSPGDAQRQPTLLCRDQSVSLSMLCLSQVAAYVSSELRRLFKL